MKKIISIFVAVILPIVMLTGCSAPLSKADYKKEVVKLVEEYLTTALVDEDAAEEILDLAEDMDEFDRKVLTKMKAVLEEEFAKADKCLDKLEKLKAPKEMEDFHEDLLGCIEKARDVEEKFLSAFDAKNEDKFESGMEKVSSAMEGLMKKIEKLIDDEDWLIEELEDSDFMEGSLMLGNMGGGGASKAKVTSADQTAKGIVDTVSNWMVDLEANKGTLPKGDVIIQICGRAVQEGDSSIWRGSVIAPEFKRYNDTDPDYVISSQGGTQAVERLKDELTYNFNFNTDIAAIVMISGRRVIGCAYLDSAGSGEGAYTELDALLNTFSFYDFRYNGFDWGGTDGIYKADRSSALYNKVIGTSPKLIADY